MSSATDEWQRALDQGYITYTNPDRPRYESGLAGEDVYAIRAGAPAEELTRRTKISSKQDLFDHLMTQADMGLVNFTAADVYEFFGAPEEQQRIANLESSMRRGYGRAARLAGTASRQRADQLGLADTGVAARQQRTIGRPQGLAASRGMSQALSNLARQFESPSRFYRQNQLAGAAQAGAAARGQRWSTIMGDAVGGGHTVTGGQLLASGNPIAAGVGGIVTGVGLGLQAGGAAGAAKEQEWGQMMAGKLAGSAARAPDFYTALQGSTPGTVGLQYSPKGSNEVALRSPYATDQTEEDSPFAY
jgi:hypothetical protein|tara:strand:+ start:501 stop:1412 length:912 start_codon:yes stop_codon:yes gene_type:complete